MKGKQIIGSLLSVYKEVFLKTHQIGIARAKDRHQSKG